MSSFVSQLNLRPGERRLLFIVLAVVFVMVNAVFVWPRFGDWRTVAEQLDEVRTQRADYQKEIDRTRDYQRQINDLEAQDSAVLPEERALDLLRTVQEKAQRARVVITQTRASSAARAVPSTNSFFDEQAITVGVNTGAGELIEFLYTIGAGDSMIRVRDMDLRPDQPHFKLMGNITLVASYQKTKSRTAGASRTTTAPASSEKP